MKGPQPIAQRTCAGHSKPAPKIRVGFVVVFRVQHSVHSSTPRNNAFVLLLPTSFVPAHTLQLNQPTANNSALPKPIPTKHASKGCVAIEYLLPWARHQSSTKSQTQPQALCHTVTHRTRANYTGQAPLLAHWVEGRSHFSSL